jgi:hypothetical protein
MELETRWTREENHVRTVQTARGTSVHTCESQSFFLPNDEFRHFHDLIQLLQTSEVVPYQPGMQQPARILFSMHTCVETTDKDFNVCLQFQRWAWWVNDPNCLGTSRGQFYYVLP